MTADTSRCRVCDFAPGGECECGLPSCVSGKSVTYREGAATTTLCLACTDRFGEQFLFLPVVKWAGLAIRCRQVLKAERDGDEAEWRRLCKQLRKFLKEATREEL